MRRAPARGHEGKPHSARGGQPLPSAGHDPARRHGHAGARRLRTIGRRQWPGRARHLVRARVRHAGADAQPLPRVAAAKAGGQARRGQVADHLVRTAGAGSLRRRRPVRRRPCGRPARHLRPRDAAGSAESRVRRQGQPVSLHGRVQRRAYAAHPALCRPILWHGQLQQPRLLLRPEFPRGRGRRAGRPEGHAPRQTRLGQCALRPVHRGGAGAGRQPVPAPGPAVGRGPRAARRDRLYLCGGVAHAAGFVQPVGRIGQRVGGRQPGWRPGPGHGADPLDPGQRTLRRPRAGATRPQRHEGGGRGRLDQRDPPGRGRARPCAPGQFPARLGPGLAASGRCRRQVGRRVCSASGRWHAGAAHHRRARRAVRG